MAYNIQYKESDQKYYMFGQAEMFVGDHLKTIGRISKIRDEIDGCFSESHMLAVLEANGVVVNLLEEDGSPLDY